MVSPKKLPKLLVIGALIATLMLPTSASAVPSISATATSNTTTAIVPTATSFASGKQRIFGADRFETAAKISKTVYGGGASTVIVANGMSFADSLSAAPLAAQLEAPLLLTQHNLIPATTAKELSRLKPTQIIVVGGTGVVSSKQQKELAKGGAKVTRLGGSDRYATSRAIIKFGWPEQAKHVVIATGEDFADALSASPVASKLGGPVVLVPKKTGDALNQTAKLLKTLKPEKLHIAGGTGAVSAAVESKLTATGVSSKRYAGADRYETSSALLKSHYNTSTPSILITSGFNFPDAVAGAAVAGVLGSAITLAQPVCIPKSTLTEIKRIKAKSTVVLGGPLVLSDNVLNLEVCSSKHSRGYDITTSSSIQVVVNKKRPLSPKSYVPQGLRYPNVRNINGHMLRGETATALEKMFAAAGNAGHSLYLSSGYRDYNMQDYLYHNYVATYGQAWADEQSARPGHSEHQTGLTADIFADGGPADASFGATSAGIWLRDNSYKYGFILRYENGMKHIVGYTYEPWHFRYVGIDVATDYKKSGYRSLEQYFGLPAAPTY